jgi:hypothetical protein
MKLELGFNGEFTAIDGEFDFETAYDWAIEHGEAHDWDEAYEYKLTDSNGKAYVIEMDCWSELDH